MENEPHLDCRKPKPGEWFRIKPGEKLDATVTRDENGTYYMITPEMRAMAEREKFDVEFQEVTIFLACNKDLQNFLWPVQRPIPKEHPVFAAMKEWICIEPMHAPPERMQ